MKKENKFSKGEIIYLIIMISFFLNVLFSVFDKISERNEDVIELNLNSNNEICTASIKTSYLVCDNDDLFVTYLADMTQEEFSEILSTCENPRLKTGWDCVGKYLEIKGR